LREALDVDAWLRHDEPVAQPAGGIEVFGDRTRQRDRPVRAPGGRPHEPGDGRSRQQVDVLEDQHWAMRQPAQRHGGGDRAAHPPGHDRARPQRPHDPPDLHGMAGQRGGRPSRRTRAAAQLEGRVRAVRTATPVSRA
jgi:hypothetical protein